MSRIGFTYEDPDYYGDEDLTWQDMEDLDEDMINDANQQSDTVPG